MGEIAVSRRKSLRVNLRAHYQLYLMALPALIGFLLFGYGPLLGQVMAFQDFDLLGGVLNSQ